MSFGQNIIDSCFSSVNPSTDLISSNDLANMGSYDADMLEWDGTEWIGDWPHAYLTIPPPRNKVGCRAIFIGNSVTWTSNGEGFCLRLDAPLIAGQTYSYPINYVSHGTGSDGMFSPTIYTSATPSIGFLVGQLPAVGMEWTMNTFSFTATPVQSGHTWIIISTSPVGSSGIINSFCQSCNDTTLPVDCNDNYQNCTVQLEIPNVFTPNNDGINDLFTPVTTKGIAMMNTIILNRWGSKMFETDNLNIEWQAEDISEGTYFWYINYTDINNVANSLSGFVTLTK